MCFKAENMSDMIWIMSHVLNRSFALVPMVDCILLTTNCTALSLPRDPLVSCAGRNSFSQPTTIYLVVNQAKPNQVQQEDTKQKVKEGLCFSLLFQSWNL